MAKTLECVVRIDRNPAEVWAVLTNFEEHPAWNPFIRGIEGELTLGGRLRVHIAPPGQRRGMVFKPVIVALEPERELAWLGRLLVPGVFDGRHSFSLRDVGDGSTELRQSETFRGLLVPLMSSGLEDTRQGFAQMNAALKKRCEGVATGGLGR